MSNQQIGIPDSVLVNQDSKYRVAYDLMLTIDRFSTTANDKKDKKYWLNLYGDCLMLIGRGILPK
ncbi:hypothetical protein [Desulfobulbus sp.]|uniref:hypothetical protein n=1 Tax=Desulfobulbus sp. TaxID=895 RepID=UPI00286F3DB0|nr:hypothetical protein [Desulfobulbus sp.]